MQEIQEVQQKIWKPHQKQIEFLQVPDSVFEAMFGGAVGAGKSELLTMMPIIREWYKHPRFQGLLLRRTYPELEKSLINRAKEFYPFTGAVYNETKRFWRWPSGAMIHFGFSEYESDIQQYDTAEFNYIGFDELTSFTEFQYKYLAFSRCRSSTPGLPAIVRSATNPGNIGHAWVKKRFVDPARFGNKIILDSRTNQRRIFIPARVSDNPSLLKNDPDYINRLQGLPEAEVKRKLDGDWESFSGQAFEDFRVVPLHNEPPNAQHVIEPFQIPDYWPRVLSIDWGYAANTVAYWWAISPEEWCVVYREYSCKQEKISTWGTDIGRLSEGEDIRDVVMCKSAFDDRGDEKNIALQFQQFSGLSPRAADNARVSGKQLVQEFFRWKPKPERYVPKGGFSPDLASHILRVSGMKEYEAYCNLFVPEKKEENLPKVRIFNTCKGLIATIPICVTPDPTSGKGNPEDVMEFDGDDYYDAFRYGAKAVERYMSECTAEFKQRQEQERANAIVDMTARYRKLELLESKQKVSFAGVKRFRRR